MEISLLNDFMASVPDTKAVMLTGEAGLGKSSFVKQFAKSLGYEFIDLRLSELEPSDLVGLPYLKDGADGEKITAYAAPFWWPKHGKVVLFLDEMDRAREDMQPIAMQLSLDRRAGGRNLPEGVRIFAACNGEKYMTSAIDQALMDRFAVVAFTPSVTEWVIWAENANIHPSVTGYIRANPAALDTPANLVGQANIISQSRRSWADLGQFINKLSQRHEDITQVEQLRHFSEPFIGDAESVSFASWVREKFQIVKAEDVYKGRVRAENLSILQISNVVQEIAMTFCDKNRSDEERGTCLRFFMAAGHEAFAALFSALPKEAAPIIEKFKDVDDFITKSVETLSQYMSSAPEQA